MQRERNETLPWPDCDPRDARPDLHKSEMRWAIRLLSRSTDSGNRPGYGWTWYSKAEFTAEERDEAIAYAIGMLQKWHEIGRKPVVTVVCEAYGSDIYDCRVNLHVDETRGHDTIVCTTMDMFRKKPHPMAGYYTDTIHLPLDLKLAGYHGGCQRAGQRNQEREPKV